MKSLLPAAALLPLSACISFGAKPPETLLTLSPAQPIAAGTAQTSATARTVTVTVPVVPQALATTRVPVQASPTSVAYVKDALWAEPPNRLFARLLADTLTTRTNRVVLTPTQSLSDPGARLGGELRAFGLDAAARTAVVTFDATLIRQDAAPSAAPAVEKRRFEASVPVAALDAASAGPALSQAANQVAAQVADWVGR
jgi:cholesterol transport system auxiliary component